MKICILVSIFIWPFLSYGAGEEETLGEMFLDRQLKASVYREKLIGKFEQLDSAAQVKRIGRAAEYADKGAKLFDSGLFVEARRKYNRAGKLAPKRDEYFYNYALSLYKEKKYSWSLIYLKMLEDTGFLPSEVNYYQALSYYNIGMKNAAILKFKHVRDDQNVRYSSLASFQIGLVEVSQKNLQAAKNSFQYILDNSKDPKLDQKAEKYIEDIEKYEILSAQANKKWRFGAYGGFSYDQNVLNVSKNNLATDVDSYRLLYGGDLSYRFYYGERSRWSAQLSVSDIYSFDNDFSTSETIQGTDPLQINLSTPFQYSFSLFGKNWGWLLIPSFQVTYMTDDESRRERIYDSAVMTSQLTISHFDKWLTDYRLEFASDKSNLSVIDPDDEQSAVKYSGLITNTYLFDTTGYKTLFIDVLYMMNDADGKNNTFTKYLLGLGGTYPIKPKLISYGKIEYFNLDFGDSAIGREDQSLTASIGGSYLLSSKSNLNFSLDYTDNSSTVSGFEYDKFALTMAYSFNSGYF